MTEAPLSRAHEAQPVYDGAEPTLELYYDSEALYCASVQLGPEAPSGEWSVRIDLHDSKLWFAKGARTAVDGSILTAQVGALGHAGIPRHFELCAWKTGPNAQPEVVPQTPPTGKRLTVAVYMPRSVDTCFVGESCEPGAEGCIGLRDDSNVLVEGFTSESMQAVRPQSLPQSGWKQRCVTLSTTDEERDAVLAQLELFRSNVYEWSHHDIDLDLRVITLPHVAIDEARWGEGVWIAPWNIADEVRGRLDFLPDFQLTIAPIRDAEQQLHHDLGGCGGTLGGDAGLFGAAYAWVPKSGASFWFECAEQPVFTHEWLHQVHWAYQTLSGFEDAYGWDLPACQQATEDPKRWFPDSHQCNVDPDYSYCGSDQCGDNDQVDEHILSVHWDPAVKFVASYCKDGRQDYDETAPDVGPSCSVLGGSP